MDTVNNLRVGCNDNGGDIMVFLREDIPEKCTILEVLWAT